MTGTGLCFRCLLFSSEGRGGGGGRVDLNVFGSPGLRPRIGHWSCGGGPWSLILCCDWHPSWPPPYGPASPTSGGSRGGARRPLTPSPLAEGPTPPLSLSYPSLVTSGRGEMAAPGDRGEAGDPWFGGCGGCCSGLPLRPQGLVGRPADGPGPLLRRPAGAPARSCVRVSGTGPVPGEDEAAPGTPSAPSGAATQGSQDGRIRRHRHRALPLSGNLPSNWCSTPRVTVLLLRDPVSRGRSPAAELAAPAERGGWASCWGCSGLVCWISRETGEMLHTYRF